MKKQKPTLIVVEDHPASAALLRTLLNNSATLLDAENGLEAIALAKKHLPDFIVVDLELPDITGLEVCRRLKADPKTENIDVLFLSGYSDKLFEVQALELGALDYMTKPDDPIEVLEWIKKHLDAKGF